MMETKKEQCYTIATVRKNQELTCKFEEIEQYILNNQSNGKNKLSSEETLKLCLSLNIIRDKFELLLKNLGKESPCSSYDSVKKLLKQPATGAYKYKEFEDVRGLYVPDGGQLVMKELKNPIQ
uniref:Uncharacterized protein n=1 Tax=Strongyloides papillosus TaxID=174720 RepID=A0A0N5CIX2_STREA